MVCQERLKQHESLEVLRVNVKQFLLEETAYSEADLEKRLEIRNDCIFWIGTTNNKGYGKAWYPRTKRLVLLHRLVWEKANRRKVPEGRNVLHSCDAPGCVNPKHLSADSQSKNIKDAYYRGRMDMSGDRHPRAIVTSKQVIEMRKLHSEGIPQKDLAIRFGLKSNSVSYIVNRRNWTKI